MDWTPFWHGVAGGIGAFLVIGAVAAGYSVWEWWRKWR
jgi:hypothetical protein